MEKKKILVVGSLVMDLIVRANRFVHPGETILGMDYQTASGGKGANQAVQAARLQAEVTMVGKVGKDAFGQEMIRSLQESGVHTQHLLQTNRIGSSIGNVQIQVTAEDTQNRIVVIPGANHAITLDDVTFLKNDIVNYDMVMLQLEIPMEINEHVAQWAHEKGVPVMLNSAPSAPLSDAFLRCVSYISPNEYEAADLTGIAVTSQTTAKEAIQVLQNRGVQNVLITRGEHGAVLGTAEDFFASPCIPCDAVVDPTAAGDSFVAAFCVAVCYGMSMPNALLFANYTASITVSKMGAQPSLPVLSEVICAMDAKGQTTEMLKLIPN